MFDIAFFIESIACLKIEKRIHVRQVLFLYFLFYITKKAFI